MALRAAPCSAVPAFHQHPPRSWSRVGTGKSGSSASRCQDTLAFKPELGPISPGAGKHQSHVIRRWHLFEKKSVTAVTQPVGSCLCAGGLCPHPCRLLGSLFCRAAENKRAAEKGREKSSALAGCSSCPQCSCFHLPSSAPDHAVWATDPQTHSIRDAFWLGCGHKGIFSPSQALQDVFYRAQNWSPKPLLSTGDPGAQCTQTILGAGFPAKTRAGATKVHT